MKTVSAYLSLFLLLVCTACSAQQSPPVRPPIPPLPPVTHPPDMPPVPPFSTEEAQYDQLKDQYMQDVEAARKTAANATSKQCMDDAEAAVAEMDQVTDDYMKAAARGGDLSSYPARYAAAALKARAAIDRLHQHMAAAQANVLIRLEQMKQNHSRRFEKDKDKLNRAYDPVRKALQPVNDATSAVEPIELMVELRLALRQMRGETITPAIVESERLQAAREILEAQKQLPPNPDA